MKISLYPRPAFERFLELGHELACVGAVEGAMAVFSLPLE